MTLCQGDDIPLGHKQILYHVWISKGSPLQSYLPDNFVKYTFSASDLQIARMTLGVEEKIFKYHFLYTLAIIPLISDILPHVFSVSKLE